MNELDKLGTRRLVTIRNKVVNEPSVYHGQAITAVFPISHQKACRLVNSSEVTPARLTLGQSLVSLTVFDFHKSPVGPYSELAYSIPVLHKSNMNLPLLPLLLHKSLKSFGFFVLDVLYGTKAAAQLGFLLTESPHDENLIHLERDHEWHHVTALCKDSVILSLETLRPRNPKNIRQSHTTYVNNNGRLVRIRMDITGIEQKIGRCNLTVKNHRLSQMLRDLDVSPRAVETRAYSNLTELFPVNVERL